MGSSAVEFLPYPSGVRTIHRMSRTDDRMGTVEVHERVEDETRQIAQRVDDSDYLGGQGAAQASGRLIFESRSPSIQRC